MVTVQAPSENRPLKILHTHLQQKSSILPLWCHGVSTVLSYNGGDSPYDTLSSRMYFRACGIVLSGDWGGGWEVGIRDAA